MEEAKRFRNLPEEEQKRILKERMVSDKEARDSKTSLAFMQKYYHRGAFFMDKDTEGKYKEEVYNRDFNEAVEEDAVDKSILPKPMQVRCSCHKHPPTLLHFPKRVIPNPATLSHPKYPSFSFFFLRRTALLLPCHIIVHNACSCCDRIISFMFLCVTSAFTCLFSSWDEGGRVERKWRFFFLNLRSTLPPSSPFPLRHFLGTSWILLFHCIDLCIPTFLDRPN